MPTLGSDRAVASKSAVPLRCVDTGRLGLRLLRGGEFGVLGPNSGGRRSCADALHVAGDLGQFGDELEHRRPTERRAPQYVGGGKLLAKQIRPAGKLADYGAEHRVV